MNWDPVLKILAVIGGILGPVVFVRQFFTDRPRLALMQKDDPGYNYILKADKGHWMLVTVFVSNVSSRPNAILQYQAIAKSLAGEPRQLVVEQGALTSKRGDKITGSHDTCVTPVNLPPNSIHEAYLHFEVPAHEYGNPLVVQITVTDMNNKNYRVSCSVSNEFTPRTVG